MFSDIKACVFDAYGTLFDVHAPVAELASEIGENASALSDLWRTKQLQYTWLRSLMREHADFWQLTGDALDYAFSQFSIESADLRNRLLDLYLNLKAYPDASEALSALHTRGLMTGILSNGSRTMLDAAVRSAGLDALLDHTLSIDEVGIYKPDPRVYQMAVDRFAVGADEICFVSANAWDAAGAAHFGFQVAHVNRFNQPKERLPGEPKAIIKSLSELPLIVNV